MPKRNQPKLYHIWQSMKRRCDSPYTKQYKDYGGRGIKVCDRWINDFKTFEADMGARPEGCTLDRIDVDGDYTPENCQWATRTEQQRNRRDSVYVVIEGKKYLAAELSDKSGRKTDTIVRRAKAGLSMAEVLAPGTAFKPSKEHIKKAVAARIANSQKRCKNGHKRTPENTHTTPEGWNSCRICAREKSARQRASKYVA
jgi:hypothetical protein